MTLALLAREQRKTPHEVLQDANKFHGVLPAKDSFIAFFNEKIVLVAH
jgi:hypothetical protein